MVLADWVNSREIFAGAALVVVALAIGVYGGTLLLSVLVSMIILAIATGAWAIRSGTERNVTSHEALVRELVDFREDLRKEHEFLGHMAVVQDQITLDALLNITRKAARTRENRLLFSIVRRDLRNLSRKLNELGSRGSYDVWARRAQSDEFDLFRTFVDSLDSGWSLDTVSDLRIEEGASLAHAGDVMDTLAEAVRRGVKVRQLYIVPADGWVDSAQLSVLQAQWELAQTASNSETFVLPPPKHDSWAAPGTFAVCVPPTGTDAVLMEMHFDEGEGEQGQRFERLEVVTRREDIGRRTRRFERSLSRATPLDEFLRAMVPHLMPESKPEVTDPGSDMDALPAPH